MNFDFATMKAEAFGVCTRQGRQGRDVQFFEVPVASDVKTELCEMAQRTIGAMRRVSDLPVSYEASESYGGPQHLGVGLDDPAAAFFYGLRGVHVFEPGGGGVLREPRTVFCYFGKFYDSNGDVLFGVRRSSSFKGVLKKRLMSFVRDELKMVEDDLFRLDADFDVLIDDEQVFILHIVGFEIIGKLQEIIKNAAAENVEALRNELPFVRIGEIDTNSIGLTVARQLAAVRRHLVPGVTFESLRGVCDDNGVSYTVVDGRLQFESDSLGDLLDVLDRRLYVDSLVPEFPTLYRANSRRRRT